MVHTQDFLIGLKLDDGSYQSISTGNAIHPESVSEVVIPYSTPWNSDVQLVSLPLQEVGGRERSSGAETIHSAQFTGEVPNSDDYYDIEVTFHEYPPGSLSPTTVEHSKHISYANFSPDKLESYMNAKQP